MLYLELRLFFTPNTLIRQMYCFKQIMLLFSKVTILFFYFKFLFVFFNFSNSYTTCKIKKGINNCDKKRKYTTYLFRHIFPKKLF
jgi:hypothetical protein